MLRKTLSIMLITYSLPQFAYTENAARELQASYQARATTPFSLDAGRIKWSQEVQHKSGRTRSCTTCHTTDITQSGKHIKTKKDIDPMALSVNKERYTDRKKIEKWFKRNCKWTWGRECSAQEKGDFLEYLLAQ
ncbi:MAG: DUF1924 domain-containing protein [Gammaproteobacteria bacterium]|nr:DUF1924 domain-containing protein [Gammaproteobacteria bacterium]